MALKLPASGLVNFHRCFKSNAVYRIDTKCLKAPNPKSIQTDMIGPMDPISNIRPIVFKCPGNETDLQKRYREKRIEVQSWNQEFWTQHNRRFLKERELYIKNNLPSGQDNLTADEMSIFYKTFLDKNWSAHVHYNIEWYKKNFILAGLAFKVKLSKLFRL